MNEQDQIIGDLSKVSDDSYFRQDESVTVDISKAVMRYRFKGLALGAPRVIHIDSQQTLPALLVTGESAKRSAQVPLSENAIIVATDIDYGKVMVGEAFPGDATKSPDDEAGTTPATEEPELIDHSVSPEEQAMLETLGAGDMAGTAWLDFKELLGLPWHRSRLALRVIAFDQVSNAAIVQLADQDSITEGFPSDVALEIARRTRNTADTAAGLPRFVRSDRTPPLQTNGVALALDTDKAITGTEPLPIHGVLRLELSPQSIVQRDRKAIEPDEPDKSDLPSAVVKATLLVTIRNSNMPARVEVDIPIWADHELQPREVIEAAFSLDLTKVLPMQLAPGTYCIYLIAGPYLSGPHPLTIKAD